MSGETYISKIELEQKSLPDSFGSRVVIEFIINGKTMRSSFLMDGSEKKEEIKEILFNHYKTLITRRLVNETAHLIKSL